MERVPVQGSRMLKWRMGRGREELAEEVGLQGTALIEEKGTEKRISSKFVQAL